MVLRLSCWMLDVGCWMLDVGCWMLEFFNYSVYRSAFIALRFPNLRIYALEHSRTTLSSL